jgi:uncharacterized protein YprB with RNaseH-like and TPR domain
MQIEKKYYHVDSIETVNLLIEHINQSEVLAYDTETTGLNVRRDQVVGWSVSGERRNRILPSNSEMEYRNKSIRRMYYRRKRSTWYY